jgi:hypothetical protein
MKSKKSKSPKATRLRDILLLAFMSEGARLIVKIIGRLAVALITLHFGGQPETGLMLV